MSSCSCTAFPLELLELLEQLELLELLELMLLPEAVLQALSTLLECVISLLGCAASVHKFNAPLLLNLLLLDSLLLDSLLLEVLLDLLLGMLVCGLWSPS